MLRFRDDIAALAEQLTSLLEEWQNQCLKINKTKGKILVASEHKQRLIWLWMCTVWRITYVGNETTSDGRRKREVISRINQAKLALNKKKGLPRSRNINLVLIKHLISSWVYFFYGSKTCTLGVNEQKRIQTF